VLTRAWGDLTGDEILEHQARLLKDPRHDQSFSQLLDFTAVVTLNQVSTAAIRKASRTHLFGPNSRRALVMNGAAGYGLARMFATYRELAGGTEQIRIFNEMSDALTWLKRGADGD
jgi:hypothetical protein